MQGPAESDDWQTIIDADMDYEVSVPATWQVIAKWTSAECLARLVEMNPDRQADVDACVRWLHHEPNSRWFVLAGDVPMSWAEHERPLRRNQPFRDWVDRQMVGTISVLPTPPRIHTLDLHRRAVRVTIEGPTRDFAWIPDRARVWEFRTLTYPQRIPDDVLRTVVSTFQAIGPSESAF